MNKATFDAPTGSVDEHPHPAKGLRLRGLTVGYRLRGRGQLVVKGIDALAGRGRVTALLGPNGTGKSTLLRTIAGLQKALSGRIDLDDNDLTTLSTKQRAAQQAIVLTDRVSPGALTGRELVALGRHPHTSFSGVLSQVDWHVVDCALADVGAAHLAGKDVAECSDGERQRIMIARALAQEPSMLLLDEPSAFLDAPSRVALTGLLRRVALEKSLVVIVSTHEVELALRTADDVWLLSGDGALHSTTPEAAALDGLISRTFDSVDLAFDVESGTFDLVAAPVGTLEATGAYATVVARMASRYSWDTSQPTDGSAADITVLGTAGATDTSWLVRTAHFQKRFCDIALLGDWLREESHRRTASDDADDSPGPCSPSPTEGK